MPSTDTSQRLFVEGGVVALSTYALRVSRTTTATLRRLRTVPAT
jgi:hypothetical protein